MTKVRYWLSKGRESLFSTLPIAIVVIIFFLFQKFAFSTAFQPQFLISDSEFFTFLIAIASVVVGMGLFSVGTEQSMTDIGQIIGGSLMQKKNLFFVLAMTFILGVLVTIAEPDLAVLSGQIGIN